MNQKQYDDMTTIMMFCRIHADQMYKCMENAGLLKQGFYLDISVRNNRIDFGNGDFTVKGSIKLQQSVDDPNWDKTRMYQMKIDEEGWKVYADPVTKTGTVPPEVHYKQREDLRSRVPETASKPYPMDGFWISAFDYDSVLDGGE